MNNDDFETVREGFRAYIAVHPWRTAAVALLFAGFGLWQLLALWRGW